MIVLFLRLAYISANLLVKGETPEQLIDQSLINYFVKSRREFRIGLRYCVYSIHIMVPLGLLLL